MIGVSEASTANLTAAAQKLILNSVYYVLGMDIPTGVVKVNGNVNGNGNANWNVNLAGQKVSDSYKGIVISNGKKYIK